MTHPLLDQINVLVAEWHAIYLRATGERHRFPHVHLADLEEHLDILWARYRRSLAAREKDRFSHIGNRIYYTTPQHK